jgi:hypothetical protein
LLNEGARWRPSLSNADPAEGMFVVRAEFKASDGVRFEGYVSPDEDAHVSSTQPTIVTADGQARLWLGGVPPTADELEAGYRTLGKTAAELFPVRYRALAEHGGAALEGEIRAFMHYESMGSDTIIDAT